MNFELIDIGQFLGAMIKLGFMGFKKEKISLPITRNKTIVLKGATKLFVSSLVLLVGSVLFTSFIWFTLVIVGIIN